MLRERFRKRLARGKVECALRFEANPAAKGELSINEGLAQQVINAANQVMQMTGEESRLNLRYCFPEKSEQERQEILDESFFKDLLALLLRLFRETVS